MNSFWQQQRNQPLFPNLLWSRPETKHGAGKLLIIGGQAQEFLHVAESYTAAENAGAGTTRVFMPESTRKITNSLPHIEYAAANQSGSFAQEAMAELLDASHWSDGVLLAGDLGKNSETNLMLENLVRTFSGLLILGSEALQSLPIPAHELFSREHTIIVTDVTGLQRFGIELSLEHAVTSDSTNTVVADTLRHLTTIFNAHLIIGSERFIWTASGGQVAATKSKQQSLTDIAAHTAVWSMQNPSKIFEAITTAVYC